MLTRIFALGLTLAAGLFSTTVVQAQYGGGGESIDCSSSNYRYTRCDVPWRDARLVRQLSDSSCQRGRTWGVDNRGLWVDRGCSARFVRAGGGGPVSGGGGGPWQPGPGWDSRFEMTCGSPQFRYGYCAVDIGGGGRVSLRRQTSDARCIEGRTWGYNRGGIWADQGCSGVFTVDRRWR